MSWLHFLYIYPLYKQYIFIYKSSLKRYIPYSTMACLTSSFSCLPSSPDNEDLQNSQDFNLRMDVSQNSLNSSPEPANEKRPRMAGRSLWQPWPQCESPSLLSGACAGPGDVLTPHRTPQNFSTPLPVTLSQTKVSSSFDHNITIICLLFKIRSGI